MVKQTNKKWEMYLNKLVRVLSKDNSLIVYGVLIETDPKIARFLPYTSYKGFFGEDRKYEWVNDGTPRSVKDEEIVQIEVIDKGYVDSLIEKGKELSEIIEERIEADRLETKLRLIKIREVKELKDFVK